MRLATVRTATGTAAVRVDADRAIETGDADLGALLARPDWRERAQTAQGRAHPVAGLDYAPLVPHPEKIVCVGLNYRGHILEMGRDLPEFPTLFAKFPSSLIGAYDDIVLPSGSDSVDWEAELAVVIGAPARRVSAERAPDCIAGYSVLNDITARDWQFRTREWLQGKTFEHTTPLGPVLVTPDEARPGEISCLVDGEPMQRADTADLLFDAAALVAYVSQIVTLRPGDVLATGTPAGVGHGRDPRRYLAEGSVVTTRIDGIGECRNNCRREKADA
ncbi:fumarylacetoacetate hydrolase family protein [Amycolatopsis anabasis]|uniref:fumarylacetoacetate hydrolase family protein n=1 Tax=Amycolatopsis anabasis TaxID=1840409 RepID=UPI00131C7849|nr:fumarylacetoacetate hydrolase family protein [Amycolatopsis anabasis]